MEVDEKRYRAVGKQVLRDRQHFADAADDAGARLIAAGLNKATGMADHHVIGWEEFGRG